mmetsp:Transcript_7761/g.22159  ORF Transcript_7761/g.22159 Transcript_7761/m.22159 type:complete len:89 (-) Transcript_7761:33-299(-)
MVLMKLYLEQLLFLQVVFGQQHLIFHLLMKDLFQLLQQLLIQLVMLDMIQYLLFFLMLFLLVLIFQHQFVVMVFVNLKNLPQIVQLIV